MPSHINGSFPLSGVVLVCGVVNLQTTNLHFRHLIGFFLFLSLTVYTAMKVPDVVDYYTLQKFAEMLKKAGLHDIHSRFVKCLPSLSNMPDFSKIRGELKASLPYINSLSSVSGWHILEHFSNHLPECFSHFNHTSDKFLVIFPLLFYLIIKSRILPFYCYLWTVKTFEFAFML